MIARARKAPSLASLFDDALTEFMAIGEQARPADVTKATPHCGVERDEVSRLRLALAVRDWSEPGNLLSPGLAEDDRIRALSALASQCEKGSGSLRGRWLLRDAPRVATLFSEPAEEIMSRLTPQEHGTPDPTTIALRRVFGLDDVEPENLNGTALRHLLAAAGWMGHRARRIFAPAELSRLLQRATRRDAYKAISAHGVFGRDELIKGLENLLSDDASPRPRFWFIWGGGGVGKSTVLATVADRLLARDREAAIVHFDLIAAISIRFAATR